MKNKSKYGIAAVTAAVAAGAYLCWPKCRVAPPENMQILNMDNTDNSMRYLSENGYADTMKAVVEPYLKEHMTSGYFEGYDGKPLYYEQYLSKQHKAHITISHGYTDGCYKYRESVYYFLQAGYSVSIVDHRGHGYSYRQHREDLSKVTISDFEEYIKDYRIFVETKVKPAMTKEEKLFIYGHSMGGAIAALLIEEEPAMFDAAILAAPMMEIIYGGLPENTALTITRAAILIGMKEHYVLGNGSFDEKYNFEGSSMDSEARYAYLRDVQLHDRNYQTSGGTYAWLDTSVKAIKRLRRNADRFVIPALLFQAGADRTVGADGQNEFARKAKNVQLIQMPNTKHCVQFAKNEVFIPYMNCIMEFLEENL